MKERILILVICSLSSVFLRGQTPDQSHASLVREMMEVSGINEVSRDAPRSMTSLINQKIPHMPDSTRRQLESLMGQLINNYIEMLVPIYEQNLSDSDLHQIIEFYQTPAGKQLTTVQRAVLDQTPRIMEQWQAKYIPELLRIMGGVK